MTQSQDPLPGNEVTESRRDRLRAGTEREIRDAARRLLARDGLPAVTMRAIAAEVGMTSPALYRYYDGHERVLAAMCVDLFDELIAALQAAGGVSLRPSTTIGDARGSVEDMELSDDQGSGDGMEPGLRMVATCRAFRAWALAHPLEFGVVFANPIPPLGDDAQGPLDEAGTRLAVTFATVFVPLWQEYRFPVPQDAAIDPVLRAQLTQHAHLMPDLPLGAIFVFVGCWARLVGMVSAEAFGQLTWAAEHTEPFFEDMLAELSQRIQMPLELLQPPD